jgi:hypothetical protein
VYPPDSSDDDEDGAAGYPSEKRVCDYSSSADDECSEGNSEDEERESAARGSVAAQIRDSTETGCKCQTNHWSKLHAAQLEDLMISIRDMDKAHLKCYIVGELAAIARESAGGRRYTFTYTILGHLVCREVFMEVHDIKKGVLESLQKTVEQQETMPPRHKLAGKLPPNALSADTRMQVVNFIKSYASDHGMPQPAARSGRAKKAPTYLPASCSKRSLYDKYSGLNAPQFGVARR